MVWGTIHGEPTPQWQIMSAILQLLALLTGNCTLVNVLFIPELRFTGIVP